MDSSVTFSFAPGNTAPPTPGPADPALTVSVVTQLLGGVTRDVSDAGLNARVAIRFTPGESCAGAIFVGLTPAELAKLFIASAAYNESSIGYAGPTAEPLPLVFTGANPTDVLTGYDWTLCLSLPAKNLYQYLAWNMVAAFTPAAMGAGVTRDYELAAFDHPVTDIGGVRFPMRITCDPPGSATIELATLIEDQSPVFISTGNQRVRLQVYDQDHPKPEGDTRPDGVLFQLKGKDIASALEFAPGDYDLRWKIYDGDGIMRWRGLCHSAATAGPDDLLPPIAGSRDIGTVLTEHDGAFGLTANTDILIAKVRIGRALDYRALVSDTVYDIECDATAVEHPLTTSESAPVGARYWVGTYNGSPVVLTWTDRTIYCGNQALVSGLSGDACAAALITITITDAPIGNAAPVVHQDPHLLIAFNDSGLINVWTINLRTHESHRVADGTPPLWENGPTSRDVDVFFSPDASVLVCSQLPYSVPDPTYPYTNPTFINGITENTVLPTFDGLPVTTPAALTWTMVANPPHTLTAQTLTYTGTTDEFVASFIVHNGAYFDGATLVPVDFTLELVHRDVDIRTPYQDNQPIIVEAPLIHRGGIDADTLPAIIALLGLVEIGSVEIHQINGVAYDYALTNRLTIVPPGGTSIVVYEDSAIATGTSKYGYTVSGITLWRRTEPEGFGNWSPETQAFWHFDNDNARWSSGGTTETYNDPTPTQTHTVAVERLRLHRNLPGRGRRVLERGPSYHSVDAVRTDDTNRVLKMAASTLATIATDRVVDEGEMGLRTFAGGTLAEVVAYLNRQTIALLLPTAQSSYLSAWPCIAVFDQTSAGWVGQTEYYPANECLYLSASPVAVPQGTCTAFAPVTAVPFFPAPTYTAIPDTDPVLDVSLESLVLAHTAARAAATPTALPALDWSTTLANAAYAHALWLDAQTAEQPSHTGEGDSTPLMRAVAAGYAEAGSVAENLATRAKDVSEVMAAFLASPGHKAKIMDPLATDIGAYTMASKKWGRLWVVLIGRPTT